MEKSIFQWNGTDKCCRSSGSSNGREQSPQELQTAQLTPDTSRNDAAFCVNLENSITTYDNLYTGYNHKGRISGVFPKGSTLRLIFEFLKQGNMWTWETLCLPESTQMLQPMNPVSSTSDHLSACFLRPVLFFFGPKKTCFFSVVYFLSWFMAYIEHILLKINTFIILKHLPLNKDCWEIMVKHVENVRA